LSEAVKQAPGGGKKKKGQKMDIRTFMQQAPGPAPGGRFVAPGGRGAPMSEKEILLSLPTGSRGKVEGEEEAGPPGLGGAFREYGGDRGGGWRLGPWWSLTRGSWCTHRHTQLLPFRHSIAALRAAW